MNVLDERDAVRSEVVKQRRLDSGFLTKWVMVEEGFDVGCGRVPRRWMACPRCTARGTTLVMINNGHS